MLWKYHYHCPNCDHQLTKNNQIHFYVKTSNGQTGNLFLSAVPGEYGYDADEPLSFNSGDKIEFYCPSCSSNLQAKEYPELVEITMRVTDKIVFEVFFSPVYGEKVTYVMMENELVKYRDDFFGELEEERNP